MQSQQQQYYQHLQSEIERINRREIEDKRRRELRDIIPTDTFIDSSTGQLDEAKFQHELERRVHSNVSVEEIAELYENIENIENYNSSNYAGKTASSNANSNSLWFLDVFDSLKQQRNRQRY
jgi:hypothetical protein